MSKIIKTYFFVLLILTFQVMCVPAITVASGTESVSTTTSNSSEKNSTTSQTKTRKSDIKVPTGWGTSFHEYFNKVLRFTFVICVLLVLYSLVMAGFDWITSGGDKGKTQAARSKITAAVIGLIVVAASYSVLTILLNFLGYDSLDQVVSSISVAAAAK